MATLSAYSTLNMSSFNLVGGKQPTSTSDTQYTLLADDGVTRMIFYGTGFTYGSSAPSGVTGGTVTGVDFYDASNALVFSISGASANSFQVCNYAYANLSTPFFQFFLGGNDTLTGSSGADTLFSNIGDDSLTSGAGNDSVDGSDGNDTLDGFSGNNTLVGGAGNDYFFGYTGNDSIVGGTGTDTLYFGAAGGNVTVNLTSGAVTGVMGSDTLSGIENVLTGNGNDSIVGSTAGNLIDAGAANDTVNASSGADTVLGGTGDDFFNLGLQLNAADGSDSVDGGSGSDLLGFTDNGSGTDDLDSVRGVETVALGNAATNIVFGAGYTASDWSDIGGRITINGASLAAANALVFDGSAVTANGSFNVFGGAGNDTITGGSLGDSFDGKAGNDSIGGGGGNDTFVAGAGNDTFAGGDGNDMVQFQAATGAVTVNLTSGTASGGGLGSTQMTNIEGASGGSANDSITGSDAANLLLGEAGNDTLIGGAGNDTLAGGAGDDSLSGGTELDTADYSDAAGAVTVNLNSGRATGALGNDTLLGFESALAGDYDDSLVGNALNNVLTGGAGDDVINGLTGNDTLDGGFGFDTASYASATANVVVNLTGHSASGAYGADVLTGIENVLGGSGNDSILGDTVNNMLAGNGGNDTLVAGGGADTLAGGLGNDSLSGGAGFDQADYSEAGTGVSANLITGRASGGHGNDTLTGVENLLGSDFSDTLVGDGNANQIIGGAGDDILNGGGGNDMLDGGAGTDEAAFSTASSAVNVNLAIGSSSGVFGACTLIGFENASGGSANDVLIGTAGDNVLSGNAGNDSLDGGAGADTLSAGSGRDTLSGGAGIDHFYFDTELSDALGVDTIYGGLDEDTVHFTDNGAGVTDLNGMKGVENVVLGNAATSITFGAGYAPGDWANIGGHLYVDASALFGANTLTFDGSGISSSGAVFINSGGGADSLLGGAGDDTLHGFSGNDTLLGGAGDDMLDGSSENDSIDGGDGVDFVAYSYLTGALTVDLEAGTATSTEGGNDTLVSIEKLDGGSGSDTILGSSVANDVFSGDGNDLLDGRAGNDILSGGDGNDTLVGGAGNDTLYGNEGSDLADYSAATGAVTVNIGTGAASGSMGADSLNGVEWVKTGSGADSLVGGAGADTLEGGAGNDTFVGSAGADVLSGGDGFDTLTFAGSASAVSVSLASGVTHVGSDTGTAFGFEKVIGGNAADSLVGSGLDNILNGLAGNDTIDGGQGQDTIAGGGGDDSLLGGGGYDTVDYTGFTASVTVNLTTNRATTASLGNDTLSGFENVLGGNLGDSIVGSVSDNVISGGAGNDTMSGGDGNDTLSYETATAAVTANLSSGVASGGAGNDSFSGFENLVGGAGGDSLTGTTGANRIGSGAGNDTVVAGAGNDTVDGGVGNDSLNGGLDTDLADYSLGGAGVTVNLNTNRAAGALGNDTLAGIENVLAGNYADSLVGSSGGNLLMSGEGNDTVIANDGDDTMDGGLGNDSLNGGLGVDMANYSQAGAAVTVNLNSNRATGALGNDTLAGIEKAMGGAYADSLVGSTVDNVLLGGDGNDTINAGAGNDSLVGGADDDLLIGGDGNDTLFDDSGDDSLNAGAGNDSVQGGFGMDSIDAGVGNDTIQDSYGANVISGGTGTDLITYSDLSLGVTVDLATGTAATIFGTSQLSDIENVTGCSDNDSISGNAVANDLSGGDGNDSFTGQAGNDSFHGGDGVDLLSYGPEGGGGGVTLDVNASSVVDTYGNTDNFDGIERFYASLQNDTVIMNTGQLSGLNTLNLLNGTDTLRVQYSGATLENNVQSEFVSVQGLENVVLDSAAIGSSTAITFGMGQITSQGWNIDVTGRNYNHELTVAGSTSNDSVNLSWLTFGSDWNYYGRDVVTTMDDLGDDTVVGSSVNDSILGGAGADSLSGGEGDDTLGGGAGNDVLDGGGGHDWAGYAQAGAAVNVNLTTGRATGAGSDTLTGIESASGGAYNDTLIGNAENNTFSANAGNDSIVGGAGEDTAIYKNATSAVTVDLSAQTATGGDGNDTLSGIENAVGSTYNDTILGSSGNNVITGLIGSDSLSGGAGFDFANYGYSSSGVSVDLSTGRATESFGAVDTLTGIEGVNGSSYDDIITGSSANNILAGQKGADSLLGLAGDDMVDAGADADTVDGGAGADTVVGGGGSDSIIGGDGADHLFGDSGNDTLLGGNGADYMEGGAGNDSLNAGDIADIKNTMLTSRTFDILSYFDDNAGINVDWATGQITDGAGGQDTVANFLGLEGTGYNDVLASGGGIGFLYFEGMGGNDSFVGSDTVHDIIAFTHENGQVQANFAGSWAGTGASNIVYFSGEVDEIWGGTAGDYMTDGRGDPGLPDGYDNGVTFLGGAGNDTFIGVEYANDGVSYVTSTSAVTVNMDLTAGTASDGFGGTDSLTEIREAVGSLFNDSILGNEVDNWIQGLGGADTLNGGIGDCDGDWVSYCDNPGAVIVNLGGSSYNNGTYTVLAHNGRDGWGNTDSLVSFENIEGSEFNDTLIGGLTGNSDTGHYFLMGGEGADLLIDGGDGSAVAYYGDDPASSGSTGIFANLTATTQSGVSSNTVRDDWGDIDTLSGVLNVQGSDFDDTILGGAAMNILFGSHGNDSLNGGGGNDFLFGGGDFDALDAGTGNNVSMGGDDNDTIALGAGNNFVTGQAGNDVFNVGSGNAVICGGAGNDTIYSGAGANVVLYNYTDGNDVLINSDTNRDDTLSFGISAPFHFSLTKTGNDLLVSNMLMSQTGVTLKDWYAGQQGVANLQFFDGANMSGLGTILNFDFAAIVADFNSYLAAHPGETEWAMWSSMQTHLTSSSATAAIGGDFAHQYGTNFTFMNIGSTGAQNVLGNANFGTAAQALQDAATLKSGILTLNAGD